MNEQADPYSVPEVVLLNQDPPAEGSQKAGAFWIALSIIIFIVSLYTHHQLATLKYNGTIDMFVPYILGGVMGLPLSFVGLSQLFRRYRNSRSRIKTFFLFSVFNALVSVANAAAIIIAS